MGCRSPTMSRVLVVATSGAGGDLQPLVSAALALRDRGHRLLAAGPIVEARMAAWAGDNAGPVAQAVGSHRPDLLMTWRFGVEALDNAEPPCPCAIAEGRASGRSARCRRQG